MGFDEWWGANKYRDGRSIGLQLKPLAERVWDAATAAERERCARVAEGIERPDERHWINGSLYDTLRRETAAELRRKP